jgi:hypothetical protein
LYNLADKGSQADAGCFQEQMKNHLSPLSNINYEDVCFLARQKCSALLSEVARKQSSASEKNYPDEACPEIVEGPNKEDFDLSLSPC